MDTNFSNKHFSFAFFNESVFLKAADGKGAAQITLKALALEESLHRSVLLAQFSQQREGEFGFPVFSSQKSLCG